MTFQISAQMASSRSCSDKNGKTIIFSLPSHVFMKPTGLAWVVLLW